MILLSTSIGLGKLRVVLLWAACLIFGVASVASGDQKLGSEEIEKIRGQIETADPPEGVEQPGGIATLQAAIRVFAAAPDSGYREFAGRLAELAREHGVEVPEVPELKPLSEGTVAEFEDRLPLIATTYALLRESEAMSPQRVTSTEMPLRLKSDLMVMITGHAPSPYCRLAGASTLASGRVLPRPGEINDYFALVDAAEAKPAFISAIEYIYDNVGGPRAEEAAVAVVKLSRLKSVGAGAAGLHVITSENPTADALREGIQLIPDPLEAVEAASTPYLQSYLRGIAHNNQQATQQVLDGQDLQLIQSRRRAFAAVEALVNALRTGELEKAEADITPDFFKKLAAADDPLVAAFPGDAKGEPHLLTAGVPSDDQDGHRTDVYIQFREQDGAIYQRAFNVRFSPQPSGQWAIDSITKHGQSGA